MNSPGWSTTVVALGFLALVGVMFWRATDSADFATIWAAVGSIVGVVVGAIPSFFFKAQADTAQATAKSTQDQMVKEAQKAQLLAGAADHQLVEKIKADNPELFRT